MNNEEQNLNLVAPAALPDDSQKKVQLTGVITPYQLHFYGTMGLSQ